VSAGSERSGGLLPCRRSTLPARLRAWRRHPGGSADEGFSLIETVVAMGLIAIVMTAATAFFVNVLQGSSYLRGKQTAVQLVDDSLEQARAYEVKSVVLGRDQNSSDTQWNAGLAIAAIKPYLQATQEAYDPTAASGAGTSCSNNPSGTTPACLATVGQSSTINGIGYTANTYVGTCVRLPGATTCTKAALPAANLDPAVVGVGFYRVIVAVTWKNKVCAGSLCSYASAELLNPSSDPIFNLNNGSVVGQSTNAPLALTNPGNQTTTTGVPVNLQMLYMGGTGQVKWTATSLPLGLAIDPLAGTLYGTPVCLTGSCSVSVTGTDATNATSTVNFTWYVKQVPQVSSPSDGTTMTSDNGIAISNVSLAVSGGSSPYSWSVSGLPPGLNLSGTTISGTPSTDGTYTVTVKVTDNSGKTDTAVVTWVVVSDIVDPGDQAVKVGQTVNLALTQHGETSPTWSATGLPQGLTIDPNTGRITGTPATIQNTTSVIKADDGSGAAPTVSIKWTVSGRIAAYGDLAGDCLDVSGASTNDNTPVLAWTCSSGINQVWTNPGDGTLQVMPNGSTLRCLTASSFANGAGLVSRPCGNNYQTWTLKPVSGGYFQIQLKIGSTTYCAGKTGSSTSNGQQMALVSCTTSAANRTYWDMGG